MTLTPAWAVDHKRIEPRAYIQHTWTAKMGLLNLEVRCEEPKDTTLLPYSWDVRLSQLPHEYRIPAMHSIGISFARAHTLEGAQFACCEAAKLLGQLIEVIEKADTPPGKKP